MQRSYHLDEELTELGAASDETKGAPVIGEPDTLGLQKLGAGIADD